MVKKIKKTLKTIAEIIFQSSWYPNNKILLESVPDLSSQTYPVFQYMIKNGINHEYRLYWLVEDKAQYRGKHYKNVYYTNYTPRSFFQKIYKFYLQMTCRAILYSTKYVGKIFDKQLQVYLIHGSPIKSRKKHSRDGEVNESDIVISLSDFLKQLVIDDPEELPLKNGRIVVTGYPRNDYLFSNIVLYDRLHLPRFRKSIIWMPTFRKTKDGNRDDSTLDYPFGLPCLYTEQECYQLNDLLKTQEMLLIIKPHPVQDMTALQDMHFSNIFILSDEKILNCGLQPYEVLGATDALITDYSSVYYDYLLTGHPIGLTTDDYEYYKQITGFCFDDLYANIIGYKINNASDLNAFISSFATGEDDLREIRYEKTQLYHMYIDDKSTERVVDLVMNEIKQRYYT